MTRPVQRLSQLITTFGPGAMIDLPTRSVVVGGLERWNVRMGTSTPINEPRLSGLLQHWLTRDQRWPEGVALQLRTPPVATAPPGQMPPGIDVTIFPTWFVAEVHGEGEANARRRRRLVRWNELNPQGGRRRWVDDAGRARDVAPIRFVAACERGHLQDIDWRWMVHQGQTCQEPLWLEERGTSADPRDTIIGCDCGIAPISLDRLMGRDRLGRCGGNRPWIGDREDCPENQRLLTRTATNTYFAQVATVISLPVGEDELSATLHRILPRLARVTAAAQLQAFRELDPEIDLALQGVDTTVAFARLEQIRGGLDANLNVPPRVAEFDVLASGNAVIGEDGPTSRLHAETWARERWSAGADMDVSPIANLVVVHRLREVSCLYGFTRFEPAPTAVDEELEDVRLAVRGASLSSGTIWLPAVEQFGEGLFIHFDAERLHAWLQEDGVRNRVERLVEGHRAWARRFPGDGPEFPGGAYVMLHSLSHALMTEIALECGYPASALKERIYALADAATAGLPSRCAILIYTASTGSQGTLGGLVGTAPRFAQILRAALRKLEVCSNDPVCADHEPRERNDDRALHGAACHGCLLIAETSCEKRNQYLDRALLVETLAERGAPFFAP